jgi:peroxiredoxin
VIRPTRAREWFAFALAALLPFAPAPAHADAVGQAAPAFALPSRDGTTVDSAELHGKVVLVDFWASWCAPCRQSFPALDDLSKRLGPEGFAVIGINLDEERADADRFLSERPVSFAIVFDPEATTPEAYGLKAMPSSFVIGRDGVVRSVHSGFRKGDAEKLEAEVRALLAETAKP